MKTIVIIQARMGSTRLPGKVMKRLCGETVLGWIVRRVRACSLVDAVVVATSTLGEDDVVAQEARDHGALVFRGSAENVLSRYCGAAAEHQADLVVRVTADCPLYDPTVLTAMLERFRELGNTVDYLTNGGAANRFPRGLGTEIMTRSTLNRTCEMASKPYELEHVTPYIYQHPGEFRLASYQNDVDLSHHRWTLDTQDDWRLIEAIYHALDDHGRLFSTAEVVALLDAQPHLVALNAHVRQKQLGE
jgi:spore coat polysaccharide biosynthesis protein SpsF